MMRSIQWNAFTIGLCGLLILSLFQTAEALKEEQREEVRRQISTVKTWQMIEELDLTEEQAQNLCPAQKSFENRKSELTEQRLKVETELTELLESKEKNRDLIKKKMVQLKKIDEQTRANEDQFHKKLSKVLTVEQQAKYELFEKRFDERLRQMIRDIQKEELEGRERSESGRVESGTDREERDSGRTERAAPEKTQRAAERKPRSERSDPRIQRRQEIKEDSARSSSRSDESRDSSASRNSGRESEAQEKTSRQQTQKKNSQKRDSSQERSSRQQDEKNRSSRSDNR